VLVDDDENFRIALRLMLQADGFQVVGEASDGFEAVEVAALAQPHFVILDTVLPGKDGQAAAQMIRTLSPRSRIVASSGALRSAPEWADGFVDKTDVAQISGVLRRL
jgi:DNA-binding NarL/FixJ family response regulator